jgi:type I restriction enzyme S subunit
LNIPNVSEQKEIATLLSCLDRKIENLRKQNKTLEAIAQTLFKHWFVNFEFPNEDGKPYKSSGGEMVRSELGEIPAGWFIEPLDEVANFLNGLALQNYPAKSDNYLPVIKIREMKAGITANTEKASLEIPSQYVIDNGDVIFSWSGSLEIIIWCFGKGALNQHLFKVSSTKYPKWFYYLWNLEHLNHFRAIAKSKATTMGHIQRKHLSEALCYVPDDSQLRIMDSTMSPILEKLIKNSLQIQTLTKARDVLLPKLMSGKLRISE